MLAFVYLIMFTTQAPIGNYECQHYNGSDNNSVEKMIDKAFFDISTANTVEISINK